MDGWLLHELKSTIEHAGATASTISPYRFECDAIEETLSGPDCGRTRSGAPGRGPMYCQPVGEEARAAIFPPD